MSTQGLFPLPWDQVLGEISGLFQFACGPEACTVTDQRHVCKHRSGGAPTSRFGGERKLMLSALHFHVSQLSPCPASGLHHLLQSHHPWVTKSCEKALYPGFPQHRSASPAGGLYNLFLTKLSRMGKKLRIYHIQ